MISQRTSPERHSRRWLVCCLLLVAVVLPLTFAPGLENTFSSPKLVLLGFAVALGLPIAAVLRVAPFRLPFPAEIPLFLWLASGSLSAILGVAVSLHALLIQFLGVGWLVVVSLVQPPAEKLAGSITLSGAVVAMVAVLQYLGIDPFAMAGWMPLGVVSNRMQVYSTLGNPNFVAGYLTSVAPLTLGLSRSLRARDSRLSHWVWAVLGLELLAIAATGSRSPVLGLIAAAVFWTFLNAKSRSWPSWAIILCVCLALLAASPARSLRATIEGRIYLWRIAAQHLGEASLFGLGPGAFEAFFPHWEARWQEGNPERVVIAGLEDHAHNDFLEIWVEQGIFGILTFLGVVATFFVRAKRLLPSGDELLLGSAAGVASMLAVALVDFPFHRVESCFLFWTLIGFLGLSSNCDPTLRHSFSRYRPGEILKTNPPRRTP